MIRYLSSSLIPSALKSPLIRRRSSRPQLASQVIILEPRLVLSAVNWTGNKGDLQWTSPQNWSTNAVPDSTSDVVINVTQGTVINGPSNPTTIHGLTITSGILKLGANAFEVTNGVSINNGQSLITNGSTFTSDSVITGAGTLNLANSTVNLGNLTVGNGVPNLVLNNATLNGSGTITIASGATLSTNHSTFNVPVVNNGILQAVTEDFTSTTFNGALTNAVGASFQILVNSSGHGSVVTVTNGFTNQGTISLETGSNNAGANLIVPKGTLTNAAGGIITFTGATTAPSTIQANLTNQGTIIIPVGQTYRVSTTNNFKNTATLSGVGTMDFTSCPTIDLGTFNISATVPKFVLVNSTLNGTGVITVNAGLTVAMNHCTINAPMTVRGTLNLATEDFTSTNVNGPFSIVSGASLNIIDNSSGHGSVVTVANGFTNSGKISLESGSGNSGSAFNVTNGTLINAGSGLITFTGATGAASTINANLSSQGTINIPSGQNYRVTTSFTFTNTGAITGPGTIDFTACPTVDLGAYTFVSSGPNFVLTNTTLKGISQLTVAAGDALTTNHATVNAPLTVNGTLNAITEDFTNSNFNGAISIAAGANFNIPANSAGHGSVVAIASGFTNLGTISIQSGSANSGSALNVTTGTLTNAAGATMTFSGSSGTASTVGADLLNQGTINVPSGQTYRVSTSNLFTNRAALSGTGSIDFTSCAKVDLGTLTLNNTMPNLIVVSTTLIGTSTLTVNTGATLQADHSTINVPIYNKGTLNLITQDFTNSSLSGPVINLAGGHMNLVVNGAGHGSAVTIGSGFTNSGILTLQAGNTGNGSALTVAQGTVLNSATGVITSTGPAGIANAFSGNLNNVGIINLNGPLQYTGLFANTGHVNVSVTQEPAILTATIQKPASLYPDLGNVAFNGTGNAALPQTVEARSFNMGATGAGFTNNSVFKTLSLSNNTYVKLVDSSVNDARSSGAEAVYVNSLTVPAGTTLDLNNLHLYTQILNVQGSVLNGSITKVVFNHAPVGTAKTVTMLEDSSYVFQSADFGFSDPNDTPPNTLATVKITSLPTLGTLTDNGVVFAAGANLAIADITGGKLKYTPAGNGNGAAYSSFSFQVRDNGGTANGGVDTDPISRKMTFSVTSVNDAPVGTSTTISTAKNTSYVFKVADFGFSDSSDSPPNAFLSVVITALPGLGSLTDNGVAVTAGAHVSVADISGGKLTFTPAANGTGNPYASFKFKVQDNGGTANGGVDTDPTVKTMTIAVS